MNGVQITTSQFGFSATNASLISFARATPSCRFMFIFQLPATIFFLIFLFFLKVDNILFEFSFFLIHAPQAQSRSAMVRSTSGMTNQEMMPAIFLAALTSGILPISVFSSGLPARSAILGRSLWLHFRMMVPSFSSRSPGLLRITVFSVVSSVI